MLEVWFVKAMVGLLVVASTAETTVQEPIPIVEQVREGGLYSGAWQVENAWDEQAEQEFAEWVEAIGTAREQRGFRLATGLRNPEINPLHTEEDNDLRFEADCATLVYSMRAYFSYKTRRPFSFQANKERRYKAGNRPREIRDFSQYPDFGRLFRSAMSSVSSGHFRMHAELEGTDTYPIDVTADSIRPGIIYYDPRGHVLIVYRVDRETGDIFMLDGHPDGTMTRKRLVTTFPRGSAKYGGGFRAWRPYHVEVLDQETGAFKMVRSLNKDSQHYSASAQYRRSFTVDGIELGYHEWVRAMVRKDGVYTRPLAEFGRRMDGICTDLRARQVAVDRAVDAGLHRKDHPGKLPRNIYRAAGEWQAHSTPGIDTKIRSQVVELRDFVIEAMEMASAGDARLKFDGSAVDLYAEFDFAWSQYLSAPECTVTYAGSDGTDVELNVGQVLDRLFALSFDPYHCPELRWGFSTTANDDGTAGTTACADGKTKLSWYKKEQRLRNRTWMQLRRSTPLHRGPKRAPKANIPGLFKCYLASGPDFSPCHKHRVSAR